MDDGGRYYVGHKFEETTKGKLLEERESIGRDRIEETYYVLLCPRKSRSEQPR